MMVIGIDLGTTSSCDGDVQDGEVKIIRNDFLKNTTPSCVAFTDSGTLVGRAARKTARQHPEKTIFNVKRLIGRRYADLSGQEDSFPFKIQQEMEFTKILLEMQGETKSLYPEQISALVLKKMKQIAEEFLGEKVTAAVITVPAYFTNFQVAGTLAGLEVLQIINEPTAAALAYGHENQTKEIQYVLIFDFGGGTLDVSIVSICDQSYVVLATSGNNLLGGEDFTNALFQHFVAEFNKKYEKDVKSNARAIQRLKNSCENAKLDLSSQKEADVEIVFEAIEEFYKISREEFENICRDIFPKIMDPVERAIDIAKISKSDIEKVILVSGSSRIPKVQALLSEFFGEKIISKKINCDEAVAYGAAIQAAFLSGDSHFETRLSDVTPMPLGIEVLNGNMDVFVPKNEMIPASAKRTYTLKEIHRNYVDIIVYEGEHRIAKDNKLLGQFRLDGFHPAPEALPTIEVTFHVDRDGILNVSAKTLGEIKNERSKTIINKTNFSKEEIERMVQELKLFENADREKLGHDEA